ncbi:MAG: N-formylglutamate amidohydrolase [Proteobacteria bacterium]|nr:MAG: N-formylglutamate amidohydrolase [Pseudomonadota bacterium]
MADDWVLLISCEHGGNKIPREYSEYVTDEVSGLLNTHRGWDKGALTMAKEISRTENAPLYFTEISRLVVDCNRSINHKNCYGPSFRDLSPETKEQIASDFYFPYRSSVIEGIERLRKMGKKVFHCSFHSFTPVMDGEVRNADFGLLYDPARASEMKWADVFMGKIDEQGFAWKSRRNYPYLGKSDGFTKFLRGKFPAGGYVGFELEFNQRIFQDAAQVSLLKGAVSSLFASLPLSRGH